MQYTDFDPFYNPNWKYFPQGFIGKALIALTIGVILFGLQYLTIGMQIFHSSAWLLPLIATTAMLALYFATHVFCKMLPKLAAQLNQTNSSQLLSRIQHCLSNKNLRNAGIGFALANTLIGLYFGVPLIYLNFLAQTSFAINLFVTGFICGVAVYGIFGVTQSISAFTHRYQPHFDFTSPDNCGGTRFFGWSLLIFSSVTLLVGILISVYLATTEWQNKSNLLVNFLFLLWIIFPYAAAIFILLVPAIHLNKGLTLHKLEQEKSLTAKTLDTLQKLENINNTPEQKKEYYLEHEFQIKLRTELHKMRTWPFSFTTNSTFFISIVSGLATSYASVLQWFKGIGLVI